MPTTNLFTVQPDITTVTGKLSQVSNLLDAAVYSVARMLKQQYTAVSNLINQSVTAPTAAGQKGVMLTADQVLAAWATQTELTGLTVAELQLLQRAWKTMLNALTPGTINDAVQEITYTA